MKRRTRLGRLFPLPRQLCARVADDASSASGPPPAVPVRDAAHRSPTGWHVTASARAHCPEHVHDHERADACGPRCARDTLLSHSCLWRRRRQQLGAAQRGARYSRAHALEVGALRLGGGRGVPSRTPARSRGRSRLFVKSNRAGLAKRKLLDIRALCALYQMTHFGGKLVF